MSSDDKHIDDAELARLGIRKVERHVFQWGEYVYHNSADAVAAAKRGQNK